MAVTGHETVGPDHAGAICAAFLCGIKEEAQASLLVEEDI